jgi:predicted ATP-dependent serine protease
MVVFWGDTKIGKSTLVQNVVVGTPNLKWLYLPFENGRILDARRLIQIKYGLTKDDVFEYYKINKGLMREGFPNLSMVDTSMNMEDLRKTITANEVDAVVIDTVDQLLTPKIVDYTTRTENLAVGLRDLSRETKVMLLIVHHISKRAGEDESGMRKRLTLHSGKGSSAMEQKADKVISIEGERDQGMRVIRSLGARDENPFQVQAMFDKETFKLNVVK